jgi:thymidylate kinase
MTLQAADPRAPLIAIVGCDGSGKSTVSAAVLEFARRFGTAEAVHLGKQSGNIGRAISRWPLVGRKLDRTIESQTIKTRGPRGQTNPKLLAALVVYAFVIRRRRRFNRMLARWQRGTIIIADRFPQIDVPGAYDGPLMAPDGAGGRMVRWLARRERRHFTWMADHKPDLVIRLNVDLETALARKPDHKCEALRRKVEATPRFRFGGADIVEIDSTLPLVDVITAAQAAVGKALIDRGYSPAEM